MDKVSYIGISVQNRDNMDRLIHLKSLILTYDVNVSDSVSGINNLTSATNTTTSASASNPNSSDVDDAVTTNPASSPTPIQLALSATTTTVSSSSIYSKNNNNNMVDKNRLLLALDDIDKNRNVPQDIQYYLMLNDLNNNNNNNTSHSLSSSPNHQHTTYTHIPSFTSITTPVTTTTTAAISDNTPAAETAVTDQQQQGIINATSNSLDNSSSHSNSNATTATAGVASVSSIHGSVSLLRSSLPRKTHNSHTHTLRFTDNFRVKEASRKNLVIDQYLTSASPSLQQPLALVTPPPPLTAVAIPTTTNNNNNVNSTPDITATATSGKTFISNINNNDPLNNLQTPVFQVIKNVFILQLFCLLPLLSTNFFF